MTTNEPDTNDATADRSRSDRASAEESGEVLSADELALDDDENVRQLGDDRFLVTTDGTASPPSSGGRPRPTRSDGGRVVTDGSPSPTDALAQSSAGFGVDLAVKTEDGVSRRRVTSNDIREVFTEMLRWYALELDSESEPAETLAVLRAASELDF
ncbi:hypothetical protein G9C85_08370 [Halorubellus sp. JP-L1]|uniref:DUF7500 family protein n=1 Tax=Halorubellus sp. JP-L1 TaxID=2715753 RepID=UPI00140DD870|nr:hypothetical protein [Halorubellus sp. JP-L1]NHN41645.1 hypothetical protein [Halorubellus sp. JP-L1]